MCNLFALCVVDARMSGRVKRGRLVVGTSRPSHHGTTSYFAQLAGFSLDRETLQQRFLPLFLSGGIGRNTLFDFSSPSYIQLLFFLLDSSCAETDLLERRTIRFSVFVFIVIGWMKKWDWIELETNSEFFDFTISRVFRSLEVEVAIWI